MKWGLGQSNVPLQKSLLVGHWEKSREKKQENQQKPRDQKTLRKERNAASPTTSTPRSLLSPPLTRSSIMEKSYIDVTGSFNLDSRCPCAPFFPSGTSTIATHTCRVSQSKMRGADIGTKQNGSAKDEYKKTVRNVWSEWTENNCTGDESHLLIPVHGCRVKFRCSAVQLCCGGSVRLHNNVSAALLLTSCVK